MEVTLGTTGTSMEVYVALTEEQAVESERAAMVDCGIFAPQGYVPLKDSRELALEAALEAWTMRAEGATAPNLLVLKLTTSTEQFQKMKNHEISKDAQHGGWRWHGNLPLKTFSVDWFSCDLPPVSGAKMEMYLALTKEQAFESERAAVVDCGIFAPPGRYVPLKNSMELAVEAALKAWTMRAEAATAPSSWFVLEVTTSVEQVEQSVKNNEISKDAKRGGWRWHGNLPLKIFSVDWSSGNLAPLGVEGWAARTPWLQARTHRQDPTTRCAECGVEGDEVWSAWWLQSDWCKQDYCARCWHNFKLELETGLRCRPCIKGCGRGAAPGYATCCRTCKSSGGGGQHGPICEEYQTTQLGEVSMQLLSGPAFGAESARVALLATASFGAAAAAWVPESP